MAEGGTPRRLSFVFRFALPPTPQQHQPKQRKEHHPKQASTDQRGTVAAPI